MLALVLVSFFISGLSWLAMKWVERIHRKRQDERDACLTAALRARQFR